MWEQRHTAPLQLPSFLSITTLWLQKEDNRRKAIQLTRLILLIDYSTQYLIRLAYGIGRQQILALPEMWGYLRKQERLPGT
jgi:hypothetical protein